MLRTGIGLGGAVAAALLALTTPAAEAKLVYRCGIADICTANDDGTGGSVLLDGTKEPSGGFNRAILSADGTKLAVGSNGGTFVYFIDTKLRRSVAPDDIFGLAFSPGGDELVTLEGVGVEREITLLCRYRVAVGRDSRQCSSSAAATPGPNRIAFGPDGRLYASYTDGPGTTRICRYAATGVGGCEADVLRGVAGLIDGFAIAPDNKRVAVNTRPFDVRSGGPIALYDLGTGARVRELTRGAFDGDPAWTLDGSRVVFTRREFEPFSLFSVAADGSPGSERRLLAGARGATFGGAVAVARPLTASTAAAVQKGTTVRGTATVGVSGATLKVTLPNGYGSLTRRSVPAGKVAFAVKLNLKGRTALKAKRRLTLRLRISVAPPAGRAVTLTRTVTLRA